MRDPLDLRLAVRKAVAITETATVVLVYPVPAGCP